MPVLCVLGEPKQQLVPESDGCMFCKLDGTAKRANARFVVRSKLFKSVETIHISSDIKIKYVQTYREQ